MDHDVFFITYDEPLRDSSWNAIHALIPKAKRIHGMKGFDAAYKACASASSTPRFFTIDGDNELNSTFFDLNISNDQIPENAVLSWAAKNSVNGLCYGNGGIKNWPKDVAQNMRTHESAEKDDGAVDFCFQLNYLQMPGVLSTANIHGSPLQAFRSGFREGVKMLLEKGSRPKFASGESMKEVIAKHVWHENLNRLRIWASIGSDVENGLWAIFGASLGAKMLCLSNWNHQNIRDYDWFSSFWEDTFHSSKDRLESSILGLHKELNSNLGLNLELMTPGASRFFKSVYINPPRSGFMFK